MHESLIKEDKWLARIEAVRDNAGADIEAEFARVEGGNSWPECFNTRLASLQASFEFLIYKGQIKPDEIERLNQEFRTLVGDNDLIAATFPTKETEPPADVKATHIARIQKLAQEVIAARN